MAILFFVVFWNSQFARSSVRSLGAFSVCHLCFNFGYHRQFIIVCLYFADMLSLWALLRIQVLVRITSTKRFYCCESNQFSFRHKAYPAMVTVHNCLAPTHLEWLMVQKKREKALFMHINMICIDNHHKKQRLQKELHTHFNFEAKKAYVCATRSSTANLHTLRAAYYFYIILRL